MASVPYNTTTANSGVQSPNYQDGTTLDNCIIGSSTPAALTCTSLTVTGATASAAPVPVTTATLILTAAAHAGKTIVQNAAAGCAIALPAATATGNLYRIYVKTTITSVGVIISATPGTDIFTGMAWVMSDNSQAVLAYLPAGTDNTLTLNGTTTGGYAGHMIEFRDVAAGIWSVESFGKATGTEATPFSHV